MYGSSGPSELGYASAAMITALFDKLIQKSVISRPDAVEVLHDAMKALSAGTGRGVEGGIRIIKESILPHVNK